MNLGYIDMKIDILKTFFIVIYTYYTFLKVSNCTILNKKINIVSFFSMFFMSVVSVVIKYKVNSYMSIICLILLLSALFSIITKGNFGYTTLTTIISASINYILFFVGIIITYIVNKIYIIKNDYINLILMLLIQAILLYRILKIKKLKHGISFFYKSSQDEYFDIIILNVGVILLFTFIILVTVNVDITKNFLISFIIFAIVMIITIYKSIQLYYKKKLLVKELEETKAELNSKKEEVVSLEKEILDFNKRSHSIAHRQRSLEHRLNKLMLNSETAEEIDIKYKLQNISNELNEKSADVELTKTGIMSIDDMLDLMKTDCEENNIELHLQISGNIYTMINHYIPEDELEILIADHVKDAIIAVKHSNNVNKSILVKLGLIEDCYGLYIYDSGIEFEKETLENLGKKPCTTHKDEGGTGMGFMNTFDTLNKHKASLIINELGKPSKDNYTKVIMIKFDEKNEFKVISYREDSVK